MAVERTLSIIKPDAVAKNVIGEILARFEKAGLRIVASRMIHLSRQEAEGFYAVHRERPFFKDLVDFIEQSGGVEQIRLGGTKPLSAKLRAGKVKDEVLSAELGLIKFDARLVGVDADWADKQVVIVATYLPTGEFQANAVIRHDSAVNAALAAYYSKQQAAIREVAEETGINSQITQSLGVIDFWFMAGGKRIHKTVHHYIFKEVSGELTPQITEVDEVSWFPLSEIVDRLAYPDEKKLIAKSGEISL